MGSVFNKILFSLVIDDLMSKETSRICPKNYGYNKAVFFQGGNLKKKLCFIHMLTKTKLRHHHLKHPILCYAKLLWILPITYLLGIPMTCLLLGIQKSDNLQYNTLVCWFAGMNDSSTKRPKFQALYLFIISHRLRALKILYFYFF